ncbi:cell wall-binding repeat-containing protein [Candidatus Poriferisodalis sp.]|uniref:cell wall-binding repeat-containing protein n=1 Tax=Candidatus Poriferisodalis sp. TaxID=3101277 RepID=UPI003B027A30
MARCPHHGRVRPLAAAAAALLAGTAIVSTAVVATSSTSGAASRVDSNRLWGADRYKTAAATAERYAASAGPIETVIVASGTAFADALAATPLSRVRNAPILLSSPDVLPDATRDFIKRHPVTDIIIAGGTKAVSSGVEATLAGLIVGEPERIDGADRYGTVVNIARQIEAAKVSDYCSDGRRTVLVATGEQFADALALSPLAFAGPHPVLLTRPDQLPAALKEFLADYRIEQVLIAGGPAAVTPAVETELSALGIKVQRLWGQDRFETAAVLAEALAEGCFESDEFGLADGRNFPDALVGGPLLGLRRAPLLLSGPSLPDATRRTLAGPVPDAGVVGLTIFGGRQAVSDAAAATAADALLGVKRTCDPRTDAAGVPREVTVQPLDGSLVVRWKAPATVGSAPPTGYRLRYRPAGGQWTTVDNVNSPSTIAGLRNVVLYEVQVAATGSGYEAWSPSSYATPSEAATATVSSRSGGLAGATATGAVRQVAYSAAAKCPPAIR